MSYVKKCPHCAGEIVEKEVKEVIYGGTNTAFLKVKAGVCLHCGEKLYTPETVQRIEEVEAKLEQQNTADFHTVGTAFEVAT